MHLIEKVPYLSEIEKDAELELLRSIEKDLGVSGVVPPAAGSINAPIVTPVVDPGPVAAPVPAHAQPVPPVSPDLAPAGNAFAPTFAPR